MSDAIDIRQKLGLARGRTIGAIVFWVHFADGLGQYLRQCEQELKHGKGHVVVSQYRPHVRQYLKALLKYIDDLTEVVTMDVLHLLEEAAAAHVRDIPKVGSTVAATYTEAAYNWFCGMPDLFHWPDLGYRPPAWIMQEITGFPDHPDSVVGECGEYYISLAKATCQTVHVIHADIENIVANIKRECAWALNRLPTQLPQTQAVKGQQENPPPSAEGEETPTPDSISEAQPPKAARPQEPISTDPATEANPTTPTSERDCDADEAIRIMGPWATSNQIAVFTGLSAGAVRQRIARAIKKKKGKGRLENCVRRNIEGSSQKYEFDIRAVWGCFTK